MVDDLSQQPTVPMLHFDIPADDDPAHCVWEAGSRIDDRYDVMEVFGGPGVTGMGVIYILDHDGRHYAAKTFQRRFAKNYALVQRFLRESRTWILVGFHPNIVRAHFVDTVDAVPYLFMEYVARNASGFLTLADRLAHGALDLREGLDLAIQCCDGMIHATAAVPGLVHRDLKPENLLIRADGTLKITDFGLVRSNITQRIEAADYSHAGLGEDLTHVGATMGTPTYMAPEQFLHADAVTHHADQYALGCTLYETFSGRRLFTVTAKTPIQRIVQAKSLHLRERPVPLLECSPGCPQALNDTVMRCLEKDPEKRWANFEELRERLIDVLERELGLPHEPRKMDEPSPRDVAEQVRSLALLDGYDHAVRMRHLREGQDRSPYAFHLALASYFRCHREPDEERRQLEKALRALKRDARPAQDLQERGCEAVRRLAEQMIDSGEADAALKLLEQFLEDYPKGVQLVLEPYVLGLLARGEFREAECVLAPLDPSLRVVNLRAHLYRAAGRLAELAELLTARVDQLHHTIREAVLGLKESDRVGWDQAGDRRILSRLLKDIAPDLNPHVLERAEHALWPDVAAHPDFAGPMAWLSDAYGQLAALDDYVPERDHAVYAARAKLLEFPSRLKRYLLRDELWLWREEISPTPPTGD